jgi:hypothetical protein
VLLALGDSITRAEGSWARLLGADVLAWDGALAADLVREALPRLDGRYDVGSLYIGVNDARSVGWDPEDFEGDVGRLLGALAGCCSRVVVLTLPRDLGRPTSAPKPVAANAILRRLAAAYGALVVSLDDFGGWRWVQPDVVHPTKLGQWEIARRVAAALGQPPPPPVAAPSRARWGILWVRDVCRRLVERHTLGR